MTRTGTIALVAAAAVASAAVTMLIRPVDTATAELAAEQVEFLRDISGRLRTIESTLSAQAVHRGATLPQAEVRPLAPAVDIDYASAVRELREALEQLAPAVGAVARSYGVPPEAAATIGTGEISDYTDSEVAKIVAGFPDLSTLPVGVQLNVPELTGFPPVAVRQYLGPPLGVQVFSEAVLWSYGDPRGLGRQFRIAFVDGFVAYARY